MSRHRPESVLPEHRVRPEELYERIEREQAAARSRPASRPSRPPLSKHKGRR